MPKEIRCFFFKDKNGGKQRDPNFEGKNLDF